MRQQEDRILLFSRWFSSHCAFPKIPEYAVKVKEKDKAPRRSTNVDETRFCCRE
jgi:hypothetical protein